MSRLSILVLLVVFAAAGCYHTVPLEPADIEAVGAYSRGETPEITDRKGRVIEVTPEREPRLRLATSRSCSIWEILDDRCAKNVTLELAHIRVEGDTLHISRPETFLETKFETEIDRSEIEAAELQLGDYVPADFEPRWAMGVMVAGPIGFAGYHVHFFAMPQLAFDAAIFAGPGIGAGFAGVRLRPWKFGSVRPFVGASASGFAGAGPTEDGQTESTAFGLWSPRLGVDIEWGNRRGLLGVEANLMHRLSESEFPYESDSDWLPWGGLYVAYQF